LPSPKFRRALPTDPEEVCPQAAALGLKSVGPLPHLRERFLHQVFRRLTIANDMPQKHFQPGRILSVEGVEGADVALTDLLPELPVVSQSASPLTYSGYHVEKFIPRQEAIAPHSRPAGITNLTCYY
jgi:hypothetical protein